MSEEARQKLVLGGTQVEVSRTGQGPVLLFLHAHLGFWRVEPFLDRLSQDFTVIAPSHPGFEGSPVDDRLNTVDDLSYVYLELLDRLDLDDVLVVGSSFGAWIALAMAIKSSARVISMVLVNPVGAHFGGPEDQDIADVFCMGEVEFAAKGFADEGQGRKNYPQMTDPEILLSSRNREAAARYAWMPPMYDQKMAQRLFRVAAPTLVLWGEADRFTSRAYAEQLAQAIGGATLQTIAGAGHFPTIEQPEATVARIVAFSGSAKD